MEEILKRFLRSSLITAITLIVLGFLLIFKSEATIIIITYVIGGILVAFGVLAGIRYVESLNKKEEKKSGKNDLDIVYGTVCVILGIIVIKNPKAIGSIIPIILGISIIISSATKLQYAFELKANDNSLWKPTMAISIISTLCGLVLLFNPFKTIAYFTKIVGVFIIIYSVLDLVSTFTIRRNSKIIQETKKTVNEAVIVKEETSLERNNDERKNNTEKSVDEHENNSDISADEQE